MAVRARKRRRADWRPMVALAVVAAVGWLVLLRELPVAAWFALVVVVAFLAWAVWRRVDGGRRAARRGPVGRASTGSPPTERRGSRGSPAAGRRDLTGSPAAGRRGTKGSPTTGRRGGLPEARRAGVADMAAPRSSGADFEELVAGLLERDGFHVQRSGGAGDRGADLKAISPEHNLVIVQCKSYTSKPVDDPMMQTFLGTARQVHNAAIPLYVTTSRFTAPARRLARDHGIVLVDGATLAEWRRGAWRLPDEPTEFVGEVRSW